jgi:very-short-patch-repair endonuclease
MASPLAPLRDGGGDALSGRIVLPSLGGRGAGGEGFSRGSGMTEKARFLRANMTDAERCFWKHVRRDRLGVRFRRQMPVFNSYILDFYVPSLKLAVEIDGGQHSENADDAHRTAILNRHGISVFRFWNDDVLREIDGVLEAVAEVISSLQSTSPLAPLRGGAGDAHLANLNISFGSRT